MVPVKLVLMNRCLFALMVVVSVVSLETELECYNVQYDVSIHWCMIAYDQ